MIAPMRTTGLDQRIAHEAIEIVKEAGRFAARPFSVTDIHAKSRTDFVTNVDFAVQEQIRRRLAELTPNVPFIGEESTAYAADVSRAFWLLDPIDGTTNLIRGLIHSAVSLAYVEEGRPVFGVVYDPFSDECFTAAQGIGAFLNGESIQTSSFARLDECLASFGTAPGNRELTPQVFSSMRMMYDACVDLRHAGCASLDLVWIACGRLDVYVEHALKPWDYAAGMLIVNEAGGTVTSLDGSSPSLFYGSGIVASNGFVHDAALALLKEDCAQ